MSILEILNDQSAFGFTGKINILVKSNGQLYGTIYQEEGFIIDAATSGMTGVKALLRMIFIDVDQSDFLKYIVEPEVLGDEHRRMKMTYENLKKDAEKHFQSYLAAKKLRPPSHLKLVIDPEIIVDHSQISPEEFDVLTLLSEWCLVSDIYKYSKLLEYEVTNALVTLRRKKAIRVFAN